MMKQDISELKYDNDPEWDRLFAASQNMLAQLADEALKDLEEGRTTELEPE